jgi:nucleoside-diphosphate-sugar epimerase
LRILISGASGFLGKYLTKHFSLLNIEFDTIGRSNNNSIITDINKKFSITNRYDLVIHAAGKAHINPKTKKDLLDLHSTNVIGTQNLLDSLINSVPKQFVYISSVSVYGLSHGEYINEAYPLLAKDPYGKSKIEAEKIVKYWCQEHNVNCTILRLPLVVGEIPPGNLGIMIQGIKKGYYFNIAGGIAKKSMVLASDIPKFILKAAEIGGTYNLTDGIHPTFNELSKSIAQNLNKSFVPNMPLFIAIVLAKTGDILGNTFPINSNKLLKITSTLTFDDSKARIAFGWNPIPVLKCFNLFEHV